MSGPINAHAEVKVSRSRNLFKRKRYTLGLFINGEYTGLTWSVNRKEAKTMPRVIVRNAPALLVTFGLMDKFYGKAQDAANTLPAEGDRIKLTAAMGESLPVGTYGTVVSAEWTEGVEIAHQYPVIAALGETAVKVPLNINEFEVVK